LAKVFGALFSSCLFTEAYIVVVMYQKTLAKYRRHEPADVTSNIATLSWIVLQVFKPVAMAIISIPLQK